MSKTDIIPKDKRTEFRCIGCINDTIPIDEECPYIAYTTIIGSNQYVDYDSCYKSSDKRFVVYNSCGICRFFDRHNCASGFCRHPSFKVEYIGDGYWDKGKKLTKWNGLYIQFPERIHTDCPLSKIKT